MIIFLPINLNLCLGCSKKPSHRDGSFEYPQHMFWLRIKKNNFLVCTLIWRPGITEKFLLSVGATVVQLINLWPCTQCSQVQSRAPPVCRMRLSSHCPVSIYKGGSRGDSGSRTPPRKSQVK